MINKQNCIDAAVRYAMRKHGRYVEPGDLNAVAWEYFLTHPARCDEWETMVEEDKKRLALWQINRELNRVLDRYSRKEKAARSGYLSEDEAYFASPKLTELLPFVVLGELDQPVLEIPEIRTGKDPAHGGDWLADLLDVQAAWSKADLTANERAVVLAVYRDNLSLAETAETLELSPSAVFRAQKRALARLSGYLGGREEKGCPYDCECHEGRLRVRPGARGADDGLWQMLG